MTYAVSLFGRELLRFGKLPAVQSDPSGVLAKDMSGYRYGFPTGSSAATESGLRYSSERAIANRFASLAYQVGVEKQGGFEAIADHPFYQLWRSPNPIMSGFFFRKLIALCVLRKAAYVLVIRDSVGRPLLLWPLSPLRVRPQFDAADFVRFEYHVYASAPLVFGAKEVLWFRDADADNFYGSLAPNQQAALLADLDAQLMDYERDMFSSGIFNTWAIGYPKEAGITNDAAVLLSRKWGERARDKDRRMDPMIGNNGAEFKAFSVGNDVTNIAAVSDIVERRIRNIYGTPRGVLGDTDNQPRANLEGSLVIFNEVAVKPLCVLVDEELERVLLPMYDPRLKGEFENPVPGDKEFELRKSQAMIAARAMVPNEWRAAEGMDPIEGGDVPYTPPAPPSLFAPDPDDDEPKGKKKDDDKALSLAAAKADALAARDAAYTLWLSAQDPAEKAALVAIRREFKKHEAEVLRRIEEKVPAALMRFVGYTRERLEIELKSNDSLAARIADLGEFGEQFAAALEPIMRKLYGKTGKAEAKKWGTQFEVDERGIRGIGAHLKKSSDRILRTSAEEIKAALKDGFREGEGVDGLSQRIRNLYDGMSRERAEMIARTETLYPANLGVKEGLRQSGIERKQWISTRDEHTRDAHKDADGQIVDIDDKFEVGGEDMDMPGDPKGSAANVIQCRCAMAGVAPGAEE